MAADPAGRTFWVDVEDLFKYFQSNPRPSGIQRLVFEIISVLPQRARLSPGAPRIAFVRHSDDDALLREVTFDSVARLFARSVEARSAEPQERRAAPPPAPARPQSPTRRLRLAAIRQLQTLPPAVSEALIRAGIFQLAALRHARALVSVLAGGFRETPAPAAAPLAAPAEASLRVGDIRADIQSGDVLLILGAPWVGPEYAALLRQLRARRRIEPVLLLYDLIPVRRPEWCAADLVARFAAWLEATLPQCGRLLAISQATATDVEAYAREAGLALADRVTPLPIGTGFGRTAQVAVATAPPRGLPAPGSYALFVSTLEARKNHALLFRVWRRLLAELPRERVPTLVFAGRVGWLVADLLQQLDNADWLDGKIRLLRDPSDAELAALYRGCQFTLFPSLFEGWGLPVSESLALGRPCLASNRTSLPEAGGDFARYFDPENVDDAYRAVRAVIEDPADLAAWTERVARDFRPVPWERAAETIRDTLAALDAAEAPR